MAPVTKDLLFQIGHIVHHLRYDYRGVIFDRDRAFTADAHWYEFQTKGKDYQPTKEQPWYHVLVDGSTQQTYVAQQNLELSEDRRPIDHPSIDRVFATFLEGRYHKENLS